MKRSNRLKFKAKKDKYKNYLDNRQKKYLELSVKSGELTYDFKNGIMSIQ